MAGPSPHACESTFGGSHLCGAANHNFTVGHLLCLVTASSNGRTPIYPPDSSWPTHLTSPFPLTPAEKKTAVLFLWPSSGPFHACPTCAQGNAITRTHHRPQHVCTETPVSGEERKRRIQEQIYGFVSCATLFSLRLIICTAPGTTWNQ